MKNLQEMKHVHHRISRASLAALKSSRQSLFRGSVRNNAGRNSTSRNSHSALQCCVMEKHYQRASSTRVMVEWSQVEKTV